MSKIKDIVFYIPVGVNLSKRRCMIIGSWIVLSIIFFCFVLTKLNGGAREIYFFYLGGIIPMFIAFQDKDYVEKKVKSEFSSLMCALYRQNIIFFIMFLIVSVCAMEDYDSVFMNVSVVTLYWGLSIPLSIIYNEKKWSLYAIIILIITSIYLIFLKTVDIGYIIPSIIVWCLIILSVILSRKLLICEYGVR